MVTDSSNNKLYDIAIVFPDWYPFLTSVIEGVLEIRGLRQHCRFRNFVCPDIKELGAFPKGYRPDGVLIAYEDYHHESETLNELGVPIVNVYPSKKPVIPSVSVCYRSLAKTIVDHFATLGFEEVGVLGTQANQTFVLNCVAEECDARGLGHWYMKVSDGIYPGAWKEFEESVPELKQKLLDSTKRIGIYAGHDVRGRLLADYCLELGVKVPEKIGILGRFDSINARLCTPELSSLMLPSRKMGKKAIQLLVDLMDGKEIEDEHLEVEVSEVRVRESTVGKCDPDMIALQARAIIRENACRGLTVGELVESLPLARSSFEKRYRALTGASPAQEIREIRISKARDLLLNSSKTIEEVAEEVGFHDPRPFVVFFKREVRKTPGGFRNAYKK